MARHKIILQDQYPYSIGARCINKEWFNLPMDTVWNIFCEELYLASVMHNLQIHSFVLMSNHYHLLASTPDKNISKCMMQFSSMVSRRLTKLGNRLNHTFVGRYFRTILHQPNYYLNTYKYNYRNPVTAGICKRVQDYPYSTLNAKLGGSKLLCPILYDDTLFSNVEDALDWLNTNPGLNKTNAVRHALTKQFFSPSQNVKSKLFLDYREQI